MKRSSTLGLILCFIAPYALAKLQVFACEPEWKALTEALGGEHVRTYSATTAFQDPHHIEARPSLIAKARRADLLVCTGAELEIGWLPLLLRQSGNANIQENKPGHFLAAFHVKRLEIPTVLDRRDGDIHAAGNPHVHWDPKRLMVIAQQLSQRLQLIDPAHKTQYQTLLSAFQKRWATAIADWQTRTLKLHGKKVIVHHKNWSYLLDWLKIEVVGDLEPKLGLPPTSAHLAHLLAIAKQKQPDYILMANYQNDKGAKWLSHKTGIPVMALPYTVGGNKAAIDLISLYEYVLTRIIKSTH